MLHGGRAGVGLHDGWKLKGQDEREQLLQQRDGESRRASEALQHLKEEAKMEETQVLVIN